MGLYHCSDLYHLGEIRFLQIKADSTYLHFPVSIPLCDLCGRFVRGHSDFDFDFDFDFFWIKRLGRGFLEVAVEAAPG